MSDDDATIELHGAMTDDEPCPYLADRRWRNLVVAPAEFTPELHEALLDRGFRRMGQFLYRPTCVGCRECRPLRVEVERFRPSKSQRRAWNRNQDLSVDIAPLGYDEEKRSLLSRYLDARHDGPMTAEAGPTRDFMFRETDHTYGLSYRAGGELVGFGILDLTPQVASSLYFFFDPDQPKRSLGVFSMMVEIAYARDRGRRYYHPGYFVEGCGAMEYKQRFRPCEILEEDGIWRPF